jgi:hypothetical protein
MYNRGRTEAQKLVGKPYYLEVSTTCENCDHVWLTKDHKGVITKVEYWERGTLRGPVLPPLPKPSSLPAKNYRCPKCGHVQSWARETVSMEGFLLVQAMSNALILFLIWNLLISFVYTSQENRPNFLLWLIGGGLVLGLILPPIIIGQVNAHRRNYNRDFGDIINDSLSGLTKTIGSSALLIIGLPIYLLIFWKRFDLIEWAILAGIGILLTVINLVLTILIKSDQEKHAIRTTTRREPEITYIYAQD